MKDRLNLVYSRYKYIFLFSENLDFGIHIHCKGKRGRLSCGDPSHWIRCTFVMQLFMTLDRGGRLSCNNLWRWPRGGRLSWGWLIIFKQGRLAVMQGFTTLDRENKFSCSDSLHGQERQVSMRRFMILNRGERLSCSDFSHIQNVM
jgi:hypothetical protein